ncbi:MAG: adenylate/guanylate cyclase domain-containing protein [Planctomycetes bacterium]|nr:adenylate/guanylate cyclase domain-containing protein [Planctomycetota bacterium]
MDTQRLTQHFRDLVLRTKISALLVLLTTVVSIVISVSLYSVASAQLHQSLRQRLQHVAITTALLVDGDNLDLVRTEADKGSGAYQSIAGKLVESREANTLKGVYTLRKTAKSGVAEFVVDPSVEKRSPVGSEYNLAQAPAAEKGFEAPAADEEVVVDEFGATLSGYAPIRRKDKTVAGIVGVDMDSSDVIAARQKFQAIAGSLFLAFLVLSIILSIGFARIVTKPIESMTHGVEAISSGDLHRRVEVRSHDEIGRLCTAINRMVGTLAVYLPVKLVAQILGGKATLSLGGVRTPATIFFSDIANFTTISEQLKPEELTSLLNQYLTAMTDIVEETGGTVDKYIGDAIMAFWGAPNPVADHALLGCETALRQLATHEKMRVEWRKQGKPECVFRIGLNSGDIVVGNMGSNNRFNYTAMGDAVNLSSRLEGANKEYGTRVMVGENTHRLAVVKYEFRKLDRLQVKGKTVPVTVYELLGRKGELPREAAEFRDAFEKGLEAYFQQKWDEAASAFERAKAMRPDDGPCGVYLQRVAEMKAHPPAANWDGSFEMHHK